jgi:CrcB protein
MNLIVAIAAGGAVGALARHYLAAQVMHWTGGGFPWGIMACNVLGSFVMGVLVEVMALKWSVGPELRSFLTVGMLGAFTTFSTFSLDTVLLLERGTPLLAGAYVVASVALSVAGLLAGLQLMRVVLA